MFHGVSLSITRHIVLDTPLTHSRRLASHLTNQMLEKSLMTTESWGWFPPVHDLLYLCPLPLRFFFKETDYATQTIWCTEGEGTRCQA